MKNLLTFLFIMATLIFAACESEGKDDTDVVPEDQTPVFGVCEPTCNADTEDCVCSDTEDGETACTCEVKPVEECKCDDGTVCPEGGKEACAKPEEPKCEPACVEGKECKCEADKCECVDKVAPAPVCEPACNPDTDECVCEADKCECKPHTVEGCKCADGTACPEGDKAKCVAAPVEDKCAGKSEGDECDTNKTCQKGEADKLECKDKQADQTPVEPSEPTEPEEPTEPAQPE